MRYAVLDVETSIFQKGHPYADRNRLTYIGIRIDGCNHIYRVDDGRNAYGEILRDVRSRLDSVARIVVFNGKFDLGWLKRYGIDVSGHDIWDVQLCKFIIGNQQHPYPSLDDTLRDYGLPPKDDTVEREYWAMGIDTPDIPRPIVEEYLAGDLEKTDACYLRQLRDLPASKRALFRLQCNDLKVLLDMEYNGIRFDFDSMEVEREALSRKIIQIENELVTYVDSWPHFNWDSGDHLSALLYGGTVSVDIAHPYEHTYKAGKRAGITEIRNRWETITKSFPGLVKPLKGSELKKEGYWSVEESVLRKIRGQKRLIGLLLERSKLEKLLSTYFVGIPKKAAEMDWQDGFVHAQFNQCRAITGRLSSANPNLQNLAPEIHKYITTRY